MDEPRVFFVLLRRPRNDPNEQRDDPFYEFGSFGCTGCHRKNLLHLRHTEELKGASLAFSQGGRSGFRLVYLTPPITVKRWSDRCEARWTPTEMPFKYINAPILAYNDGRSDFPLVEKFARQSARSTIEGGLSSRLRSLVRPLQVELAREVIAVYQRKRAAAAPSAFASTYVEALPSKPPKIDLHRERTYKDRIRNLKGTAKDGRCGKGC